MGTAEGDGTVVISHFLEYACSQQMQLKVNTRRALKESVLQKTRFSLSTAYATNGKTGASGFPLNRNTCDFSTSQTVQIARLDPDIRGAKTCSGHDRLTDFKGNLVYVSKRLFCVKQLALSLPCRDKLRTVAWRVGFAESRAQPY
jgi:hypothetical protein